MSQTNNTRARDSAKLAGIAPSANVQTLIAAADYAAFKSSLGLGSMAAQGSAAVRITGAIISNDDNDLTIAGATITGGTASGLANPIAVSDGGTGAQTAASARTNLGLGTVATLATDTDGVLAANSDSRVSTQRAIKTYVDNAVTGLLEFKGATNASANPNYPAANKGDAYVVSVAGKIGGASGKSVDIGDVYLAIADNAGGAEASVGASWTALEHNLIGAVLTADVGSTVQAYDADLAALAGLSSTGLAARTASNTWAQRTLVGTANQVNVSNGDGVSGNPTLSLPQAVAASSSPTFAGLNLTGMTIATVSNLSDVTYTATAALRCLVAGFDGCSFQLFGGDFAPYSGQMYFDYGSVTRNISGRKAVWRSASLADGPVEVFSLSTSEAVFNDPGNAVNFRVESDNIENMVFVDGTNDRVGVGTATPATELEVVGTITATGFAGDGTGITNLNAAVLQNATPNSVFISDGDGVAIFFTYGDSPDVLFGTIGSGPTNFTSVTVGPGLSLSSGVLSSTGLSPLFDHYATIQNVGTAETDLFNDTIPGGTMVNNGDKLKLEAGGFFASSGGTATRRLRLYLRGTLMFDSGALTIVGNGSWTLSATVMKTDTINFLWIISLIADGVTLTSPVSVAGDSLSDDSFDDDQTLRLTATAAGTGAGSNQISLYVVNINLIKAA